jgi:GntP family gluconate:H+ symporter
MVYYALRNGFFRGAGIAPRLGMTGSLGRPMLHDVASYRALLLLAVVIVLLVATQLRRVHPFIAILAAALAFAYLAGMRTAVVARQFGIGFSAMSYMPGLLVVAACLIGGLAEGSGASGRLMAFISGRRALKSHWIASSLGLIAGLGASPAGSFALLSPLLRPIGGKTPASRESATVALALGLSASHGLAVLSPVAIAAVSILGADWQKVALLGSPMAIVLTVFAALFSRTLPGVTAAPSPEHDLENNAGPIVAKSTGSAVMLLLATTIPLLMEMARSLADIPSEPLGGEPGLEQIVTMGAPVVLLLVGVALVTVGAPRRSFNLLADATWMEGILAKGAGILLIVCAAGGFQAICQQSGMAEALAARVLEWHLVPAVGLLLPFLAAATVKTLQGSSLVAAITAAGMVQPLLVPLGLAGANDKALSALAVGIGAVTICHLNDEYFWVVSSWARFSPMRGMATIGLGTLLQGLLAAAMLLVASLFMSNI